MSSDPRYGVPGPQAELLVGGTAAFDRMCQRIESARRVVDLETYIYKVGAVGDRFRDALTAAARRGVRVRVLVDSYGSDSLPSDYFAELVLAGGEVRWFNPRRLLRLSFRNHRKLLRYDDSAVVGGVNIADEYDGDGITRGWRDFAVEVSGPVVDALAASFERMWGLAPFGRAQVRAFWFHRPRAAHSPRAGETELLLSGPGCRTADLRRRLALDIRDARRCLAWAAYFLPSRRLARAIRAGARAREVAIVLGARTDVPLSQWASERYLGRFLRAGVRVHYYQPQIVHAKVVIADDVVYFGSANLDVRSLRINYELLIRMRSPVLAAALRAIFSEDVARSEEVVLEHWRQSRRWWHRLRSYLAYQLLARLDPYIASRKLKSLA